MPHYRFFFLHTTTFYDQNKCVCFYAVYLAIYIVSNRIDEAITPSPHGVPRTYQFCSAYRVPFKILLAYQILFFRLLASLPPRGGGRLLVNCVPMREQRIAKLTQNSVFDILKLIPLFTVANQKITISNEVNYNAYSLTSATICKRQKKYPFLQN